MKQKISQEMNYLRLRVIFFPKWEQAETAQRVIASQILASGTDQNANHSTSVEESLQRIGGVACQLKDKNLGDPKAAANADLTKLAHAMANAVFGIAAAVIDIAITADSAGLTIAVVGFVSTSWGWDHITSAWEEAKAAWASFKGVEKKG